MSELARRPNRPPRHVREQRAYQLVVAGGGAAVIAVAGAVLWVLGVIGFFIPAIAAIAAIICGALFNRTVR